MSVPFSMLAIPRAAEPTWIMRPDTRLHSLLLLSVLLLGAAATHAQAPPGPLLLIAADIGEAYYDEVPADVSGPRSWVGLYLGEDGSRLAAATVRFVPEADGAFTVFTLTVDPPGPHLLLSGVEAVSPGPAETVVAWPVGLTETGASIDLPLGRDGYRVRLESSDPYLCDAAVWLELGGRAQRLYGPEEATFSCDEPHFEVSWAGDVDRDGRLDLAVSFSSKYSHHPRLLLLSSAAGPDQLVGPAALFERFAR